MGGSDKREIKLRVGMVVNRVLRSFAKPMKLTGVIYEFIEREAQGFCADNVKDLMNSTKGNKF